MRFDVLTLFPELFEPFLRLGLVGKACAQGLVEIEVHDLRQWAYPEDLGDRLDPKKRPPHDLDDAPYGGGDGMVLRPEPLAKAIEDLKDQDRGAGRTRPVIFLTPQGKVLNHAQVKKFADSSGAILLSGRYAGIDERIREFYIDQEVSIGDYVLMGGELPAMVVLEACLRHVPGVLGNRDSASCDSFENSLLESPQYTRPAVFAGKKVPEVLLSGDHKAIKAWREAQARQRTKRKRPDLLNNID